MSNLKVFRCPKCGKAFAKSESIERHRNQPRSSCAFRRRPSIPNLIQTDTRVRPPDEAADAEDENRDFNRENGLDEVENNDGRDEMDVDDNVGPIPEAITQYIEYHPNAGRPLGRGFTFMDKFDTDQFSQLRVDNLYYPFSSKSEWEVGAWLLRAGLSMALINNFMRLELIRNASLSFSNAKQLRGRAEILPSGPPWMCKELLPEHPTKQPVKLFYRDALACLQLLMSNPFCVDAIEFTPFRMYKSAAKTTRIFTEWLSGDVAWEMQSNLPPDATLLGAILSSDKTLISIMTGNHSAYPLYISLANLKKEFRLKNLHKTFILLALLPTPKFIHSNTRMRTLLQDRLTHSCLDFVLGPLKKAALSGHTMSDPKGFKRRCYTFLASYTVDTPEAQLLACVGGKSSPVTTAYYKEFGDPFRHETRTASATLEQLRTVRSSVSSAFDIAGIFREARKVRLNGVHEPFWRNWFMAEPSLFLTPEPLHHWHKQFWDHDVKWSIAIVGAALIDFMFSILPPRTGFRQFLEGISSLKQVTGRDHREVQRYIIPVIGCTAPREVVLAIRSLMDFRYFGQSPVLDTNTCQQMQDALQNFHRFKHSIIQAGGRLGKNGNVLDNWYIPKIEFYQSVIPNIIANGVPHQWTADITEHCHHTDIKVPARSGNNQNYDTQIVRYLDRQDKLHNFDVATAIRDSGASLRAWDIAEDDNLLDEYEDDADGDNYVDFMDQLTPASQKVLGAGRKIPDYFIIAEKLLSGDHQLLKPPPRPFRIFSSEMVAFRLARDPSFRIMTIDSAATQFLVPDLKAAVDEFHAHLRANGDTSCRIGGRRRVSQFPLPSENIQVWCRLSVQNRAFHSPHNTLPPETLNCYPPSTKWPHGLYDTVLVNTDSQFKWPQSKLNGHSVAQLRLIFRLVPPRGVQLSPGFEGFLAYVQRLDVLPQSASDNPNSGNTIRPDPTTGMFALRRSFRADGSRQGGVIQVKNIRKALYIVPRFRRDLDARLTKKNSLEYYSEFWLDDYFDKETFYSFRSNI